MWIKKICVGSLRDIFVCCGWGGGGGYVCLCEFFKFFKVRGEGVVGFLERKGGGGVWDV